MRVLILGAAGFLGRHVTDVLRAQSGLSVCTAPERRHLDLGRATPVQWTALLDATRPDVIVNCAGRTDGPPEDLRLANTDLVRGLVDAAQVRRAPPRIIHLGSAAEYGPGQVSPAEDAPTRSASPYGESKLEGTRLLLAAPAHLPRVVLRPFNPLGNRQPASTVAGRAARQFRQAVRGGWPVVAFGDLSAERDFIAAADVARAVLTAVCRADLPAVLNVGRGEGLPVRDVVHRLARLSGFTGELREDASGSDRSSRVSRQWADSGRLRALGWTPLTPLDEALSEVWRSSHDVPDLPGRPSRPAPGPFPPMPAPHAH